MRVCQNKDCGNIFFTIPSVIAIGSGKFCSGHCANSGENNPAYGKTGEKSPIYGRHPSTETCIKMSSSRKGKHLGKDNPMYGRTGEKSPTYGRQHTQKSIEKMRANRRGKGRAEKNGNWHGGVYGSYCPEFNEPLKAEIRDEFGHRCFLSDTEEDSRKLDIHHCDYFKSQGCQGQRWSLLPLTRSSHARTNYDRWYWFALLRDYWIYKYLDFHGMDIFNGQSRTEWLWKIYDPWKGLNKELN